MNMIFAESPAVLPENTMSAVPSASAMPDRPAANDMRSARIDNKLDRHAPPSDSLDDVHGTAAVDDPDPVETPMTQAAADLARAE